MKKHILLIAIMAAGSALGAAEIKAISLESCTRDALASSPKLKQLRAQAESAALSHKASKASYYPSLNLEASGSWVSETPEIKMGGAKLSFGDNWGYSVGPAAEYTLFDNGVRSGAAKSAGAAYSAAQNDLAFAEKSLILDVRRAYFEVQRDLENIYYTSAQVNVAQKQLRDIQAAFKAGAKSSLDVALALKQELRARVNISAARGALGAHLRELFTLTGTDYGIDALYPMDWRVKPPAQDKPATVYIKADDLSYTLKSFGAFGGFAFDENNAKLAAASDMADYYKYLGASLKASLYPVISLKGGAYLEYPNGPIREEVFLGRAGVSMRLPLYEAGKTNNRAAAQQSLAEAAAHQKTDLADSLRNMFESSKNLLYPLDIQAGLSKEMIKTSQEAANLTYEAYKAGAVTFLDVDTANLALLESQISLADIYIQKLNRLAVLDNLGAPLKARNGD